MPIQCMYCKHYLKNNRCKAFQDKQIPYEIMTGQIDHDIVLPYQNGDYVYEEIKQEPKKEDTK